MVKVKINKVLYDRERDFIFLEFINSNDKKRKVLLNQYKIDELSQFCHDLKNFQLKRDSIKEFVKLYPFMEVVKVNNDYNSKIKNKKAEFYQIVDIYKFGGTTN